VLARHPRAGDLKPERDEGEQPDETEEDEKGGFHRGEIFEPLIDANKR
jgi:hypothetical protein